MTLRVGFVVNPLAGIGGPAALKGSDGLVDEAVARGYGPVAALRAGRFLDRLRASATGRDVRIFAAPGVLGADLARAHGWKVGTLGAERAMADPFATDAADTEDAAREAVAAEMDLFVFVGGDGTARDVARGIGTGLPALGVPAGVKMFSECFADTPEAAADVVASLSLPFETEAADVLDLDEEAYRKGEMRVLHHDALRVPRSPRVQAGKCATCPPGGLADAVAGVRARMADRGDALYVLGSGSTLAALKADLGVEGTLIGVDVVRVTDGAVERVDRDVDARTLDRLVAQAQGERCPVVVVVSPIGGQGFIVGRGTAQIGPGVLHAAGADGLWVVATPGKLDTLADGRLRVDTGDARLDAALPDFVRVTTAPDRVRMVRLSRADIGTPAPPDL